MAKTIINKFVANHDDIAAAFSANEEYSFGEIIICNDPSLPSLNFKNGNGDDVSLQNAKVDKSDNFIKQLPDGTITSQLNIVWNPITQCIDIMGKDGSKINSIDGHNIATLASELESVESVVFQEGDALPEGVSNYGGYLKFALNANGVKSYMYAPIFLSENIISGEGIEIINENNLTTISHEKVLTDIVTANTIAYDNTKEVITNIETNDLGHVTEITKETLPKIDCIKEITYGGESLKDENDSVSLDIFALKGDIPEIEETKVVIENGSVTENEYVSGLKAEDTVITVTKGKLPKSVLVNELSEDNTTLTIKLNDGINPESSVVFTAGENIEFSENEKGINVSTPNISVKNDENQGAFVSNIVEDIHGIKITKSNLPELSINGNVYDGTQPVDITIVTADGDTKYRLVENAAQTDKKFTITLLDSIDDNADSNAVIDLSSFLTDSDIEVKSKELSWGEEVILATISGNTITAKMPEKPEDVVYKLAQNAIVTDKKVTIDMKADEKVDSSTSIDLTNFALLSDIPTFSDGESALKWGEKVDLGRINDVIINAELPSSPAYSLSNGVFTGKKATFELRDANNNILSTSVLDLSDFAYSTVIPDVEDRESVLQWGTSTTLAIINDIEINASLPESPIYSIENGSFNGKKATFECKKQNGEKCDDFELDLTNFAQINEVPKVSGGNSVLEWNTETRLATVGDVDILAKLPVKPLEYELKSTVNEKKITLELLDSNKNDAGTALINLDEYVRDSEISIPEEAPTLQWGSETTILTIDDKDLNLKLPSVDGSGIAIMEYELSGDSEPNENDILKITLTEKDKNNNSTDTDVITIDFSKFAKDVDLTNPNKHYDTVIADEKDLVDDNVETLTEDSYVISSVETDINGHIKNIIKGKLPSEVSSANNAKTADKLNTENVGDENTVVYFKNGIPVAGNVISDTATTQEGHYAPSTGTKTVSGTNGEIAHGGTIKIPSITFDSKGHFVSDTTTSITLPKDNDSKVTSPENHYEPNGTVATNTLNETILTNGAAVVTNITRDVRGHVTKVETQPLPSNAKTADKLNTENVGDENTVVYFKDGIPVAGNVISDTATTQEGHYAPSTITKTVSGNGSLNWGEKIEIPSVSFDNKGHFVSGTTVGVTMPSNPNTHYTSKNIIGGTANATANAAATNGNVYLNHLEENAIKSSHKIVGDRNVTVVSDSNGNVTISGPDLTSYPKHAQVEEMINDKIAANDAMLFKGVISSESLPSSFQAGWTYKVAKAGTYYGQKCEIGDMIIATQDGNVTVSSSNFSTYWSIVQANVDGVVIGPASSVNDNIAIFDGLTGKVIKDSGMSIGKSVPHDALFTDTNYYLKGVSGSGNGTVTFTREGLANLTWNASHTHNYLSSSDLDGYATESWVKDQDFIQMISATASVSNTTGTPSVTVTTGGTSNGPVLNFAFSGLKGTNGSSTQITGATATVDSTAGTPSVTVTTGGTSTNMGLNFKFTGLKGEKGSSGSSTRITGATASIDGTAGTPSVTVTTGGTSTNMGFNFAFSGLKGEQGSSGTSTRITGATATVDSTAGTPSVTVTTGGTSTMMGFNFAFTGLKGAQGASGSNGSSAYITGATASVSNTTGTPSVTVTSTGTNTNRGFNFAFSGLKGEKGDSGVVPDPYFTINAGTNLTGGGTFSGSNTSRTISLADTITLAGNVTASHFYESSDEKLKNFGEDIEIDFNKLKTIPKKYFTWKDDNTNKLEIGTSAQKVQMLFPECVGTKEDGTLTVDYGKLCIPALKAIDILYDENQKLKNDIAEMTSTIELIKEKLGL